MEESLQVVPSSVAADNGNAASGISCHPTSVNVGLFAATNTAFMAAAAQPDPKAAVSEVGHAAEATAAQCQPKAKRRQSGTPPPAKRSKVVKAKVESEASGDQSVALATKETRLTRQRVQGQAKTFAGKEIEYFQAAQKNDHLSKLPSASHEYVSTTRTGAPRLLRTCNDPPYAIYANAVVEHPKIKEAVKRGVFTKTMAKYYLHMSPGVNIPVAGIPLDKRQEIRASKDVKGSLKKSQIVKGAPESAMVASASKQRATRSAKKPAFSPGSVPLALAPGALHDQQAFIEEATKAMNPSAQTPRTLSDVLEQALNLTYHLTFGPISSLLEILESRAKHDLSGQEEAFYARPSIKIIIPDMLKGLLVDDWENVTKNNQLVPIPHPKPVTKVMDDYLAYEKPRRTEGSAAIDILEETVSGLKEYFDKSLGRILLYRFERAQYAEIREKWTSGGSDVQGKTPCDTYGAEHLMRLITSLPELIAQTNMDQQSVNRLREELSKFCQWLERNAGTYFVSEYESPNAEYAEKAKN
ncbi:MRG-domain-containing protein [Apiospora rasikravindrae]|uniref:MRG-domain-containing protein n=1 Tax=Apiospora rasikravindrae TaxID=990691 RepID=A0ABR1SWQ1_9PEZI